MRAAETWIFFPRERNGSFIFRHRKQQCPCVDKGKEMVLSNFEFLCIEPLRYLSAYKEYHNNKGDIILNHRPLWNSLSPAGGLEELRELLVLQQSCLLVLFSIADTSKRSIFCLNAPLQFFLCKNSQIPQVVILYKAVISSCIVKVSHRMKMIQNFLHQRATTAF